jgi:hypothetical protein
MAQLSRPCGVASIIDAVALPPQSAVTRGVRFAVPAASESTAGCDRTDSHSVLERPLADGLGDVLASRPLHDGHDERVRGRPYRAHA